MQALIVPVYLNQRIVFDLLAMMQDGISTVTRVSSSATDQESEGKRYGAAFGLSSALASLLKVELSGEQSASREETRQINSSEERIHTPASLFFKLRHILESEDHLVLADEGQELLPGNMVEFSAALRRNPLIEAMDALVGVLDIALMFGDEPQKPPQKGGKRKQVNETQVVKGQMERFTGALKAGDTIDLVSDRLPTRHSAVLTLEQEYLNDPSMADLVDGHFKVLGKIVRVIPDENGSLSLIRKSSLSAIPTNMLDEAFSHFEEFSLTSGFNIPEMKWEIRGPLLHVIPVAIYA